MIFLRTVYNDFRKRCLKMARRGGIIMNEIELVCFRMISALGAARSAFMEAMVAAKKGNFEEAQSLIEEGQQQRLKGHEIHFELLQKDSSGNKVPFSLLLLHSEDQLMSVEILQVTSEEVLALYQRLDKIEKA